MLVDAVNVAGLIVKLPETTPNIYSESVVIEVIFVGYTYVPTLINVLGVPDGAGVAGVPVSVYAWAEPVYVTFPLTTTSCGGGAVHVITDSGVLVVTPVIESVISQYIIVVPSSVSKPVSVVVWESGAFILLTFPTRFQL